MNGQHAVAGCPRAVDPGRGAVATMSIASTPLGVRCIAPGEPLGDVHRLRREVYFREQGLQGLHRSKRISDGLDASGTVVVVECGDEAVATLRLHDFASPAVQVEYGSLFMADDFASAWPLQRIAVSTRLAVQADQRTREVTDLLIREAYRHALGKGIQFGLIACEPFLHSVFEHYGFREYLPPTILPGGIALLRMVLVMEDAEHLGRCGSPLLPLVRNPAAGANASAWLMRRFGVAMD